MQIISKDGQVIYHKPLFGINESCLLQPKLMETIRWEHDELYMFGKKIVTKRKVAWYGDKPYQYTYSKSTKTALLWNDVLQTIKSRIEEYSNTTYNSCLLNLYHDGSEGMGWHSDDEPELLDNGTIASVSFGADRKFVFKHKTSKEKVELILESGSLLLMTGECQKHWLHRLPPTKKVNEPRINLTFRTIVES